jgi:hypothetical protein
VISQLLALFRQPSATAPILLRLLLNRASMLALGSGKNLHRGRAAGFFAKMAFFLNALQIKA